MEQNAKEAHYDKRCIPVNYTITTTTARTLLPTTATTLLPTPSTAATIPFIQFTLLFHSSPHTFPPMSSLLLSIYLFVLFIIPTQIFAEPPRSLTFTGFVDLPTHSQLVDLGYRDPQFTVISGQIPPGLTLDQSSGVISGTALRPGNQYMVLAEVVDGISSTTNTTLEITFNVYEYPDIIWPSPTLVFDEGIPSTVELTVIGYPPPTFTPILIWDPEFSFNGSTLIYSGDPLAPKAARIFELELFGEDAIPHGTGTVMRRIPVSVRSPVIMTGPSTSVWTEGSFVRLEFYPNTTWNPIETTDFTVYGTLPPSLYSWNNFEIAGTLAEKSAGVYPLFLLASNGVPPVSVLMHTITVVGKSPPPSLNASVQLQQNVQIVYLLLVLSFILFLF